MLDGQVDLPSPGQRTLGWRWEGFLNFFSTAKKLPVCMDDAGGKNLPACKKRKKSPSSADGQEPPPSPPSSPRRFPLRLPCSPTARPTTSSSWASGGPPTRSSSLPWPRSKEVSPCLPHLRSPLPPSSLLASEACPSDKGRVVFAALRFRAMTCRTCFTLPRLPPSTSSSHRRAFRALIFYKTSIVVKNSQQQLTL